MNEGIGSAVIYKSVWDGISQLEVNIGNELLRAVISYQFTGEQPKELSQTASAIWTIIKPLVDSSIKNKINGSKGGRPKCDSTAGAEDKPEDNQVQTQRKPSSNPKLTQNKPNHEKAESIRNKRYKIRDTKETLLTECKENAEAQTEQPGHADAAAIVGELKQTYSAKPKYGAFKNVVLTDGEYAKLKIEFPADYGERIERLSEYMAAKKTQYKNHLAVIRMWARRDGERGSPPAHSADKDYSAGGVSADNPYGDWIENDGGGGKNAAG